MFRAERFNGGNSVAIRGTHFVSVVDTPNVRSAPCHDRHLFENATVYWPTSVCKLIPGTFKPSEYTPRVPFIA